MSVSVVLVKPRNPLNIGAAARAMSNFGIFDLRLVDPYRVAVEEVRSAVKAGHILAQAREFATVAEAVAGASFVVGTTAGARRELHQPLQRLDQGVKLWREREGALAILFGSEKFGLENDALSYCHALWRIPSRPEHDSMNLGQAVAVVLYELIREEKPLPERISRRATQEELQRVESYLRDALAESGYLHSPSTEEKIRRMVLRLDLSPHDAEVWQGMLRQILWKLRHNRE